jgi:hypothetical protein
VRIRFPPIGEEVPSEIPCDREPHAVDSADPPTSMRKQELRKITYLDESFSETERQVRYPAKSRANCARSGLLPTPPGKSKSFQRGAKPTRWGSGLLKVTKGLAMARGVLHSRQTKWRATGYSEQTSARGRSGCPFAFPFRRNTLRFASRQPSPDHPNQDSWVRGGVWVKQPIAISIQLIAFSGPVRPAYRLRQLVVTWATLRFHRRSQKIRPESACL